MSTLVNSEKLSSNFAYNLDGSLKIFEFADNGDKSMIHSECVSIAMKLTDFLDER